MFFIITYKFPQKQSPNQLERRFSSFFVLSSSSYHFSEILIKTRLIPENKAQVFCDFYHTIDFDHVARSITDSSMRQNIEMIFFLEHNRLKNDQTR